MLYVILFTKSCNNQQTHSVPISKLPYVHTELKRMNVYMKHCLNYNTINVWQ